MRITTLAVLCLCCSAYCCVVDSKEADSVTWNWMPEWRDSADCGPNALYVLMNLEGHKVKLEDVKKLIPLDPVTGCSMEALIEAVAKLGFVLEARFVKPGDVHKLSRPFILHGITSQEQNLGHFIVVVGYDSKERNFALIDPVRETYGWNPESSLLYGYSGYVLVPKYSFVLRWNFFAGMVLIIFGLGYFVFFCRHYYAWQSRNMCRANCTHTSKKSL